MDITNINLGACPLQYLSVGYVGEAGARPVAFDFSAWTTEYGSGVLQLLLQRPGDADPYPVLLDIDGTTATWTPDATATEKTGQGQAQLIYTVGGVVVKNAIFRVLIAPSLGAAGNPPEPYEDWLERLLTIAAETQQSAIDAAGSAEAAGTSAGAAAGSAGAAAESALDAEAAKSGAEAAETAAGQSAALAGEKAAQAAQSAEDAQAALEAAQLAADAAGTFADDAEASKTAAALSASEASQAKADAQSSASAAAASEASAAASAAVAQELIDQIPDIEAEIDKKAPAIYETVGPAAIASFADGADDMPLKSLVVDIPVTQSGSGDPSPENVRAFVGRTGLTLHDTRKNLVDWDSFVKFKGKTWNGLTMDYSDGVYSMTGTATATRTFRLGSPDTTSVNYYTAINLIADYSVFLPAGLYKCSVRVIYGTDLGKPSASANNGTAAPNTAFELTQASWVMPIMSFSNGNTYDTHNELMLWQADENDTYEPYEGRTVAITFPTEAGTVYGGTLTLNADGSGTLTKTHGYFDGGAKTWTKLTNYNYGTFWTTASNLKYEQKGNTVFSSNYKPTNNNAASASDDLYCWAKARSTTVNDVYVKDTANANMTAAEFKAAMSGVQFVYVLANPVTYQLTAEQIRTLAGSNNIWSDAGDVTAVYPADTKSYIDSRTRATRSMIAGIETGMTASRAYSVGELLIVGDMLYSVIAAIANGATLTPGTNVTATTVAEQLLLLANL